MRALLVAVMLIASTQAMGDSGLLLLGVSTAGGGGGGGGCTNSLVYSAACNSQYLAMVGIP
jgi:hypothetical protein